MQERQTDDSDPIDLVESATTTTQAALQAAKSALAAVQVAQDVLNHKEFSHVKFLGTVGHELRTPLASILGYTQLLRDELGQALSRHHQEFFKTILTNVKLSLELINDLSAFTRMDGDQMAVSLRPVPLQSHILEVVNQLHAFAEEKGILLSADLPMEEYYVRADTDLLHQIVHNIVSYAIRYTDDGSVTVQVLQAADPGQDAYHVEIIDTGRGLRDEVIDTAWTMTDRQKRMGYLMEEGISLSLTMALEYIRTMEGEIDIKSVVGHGSVYRLTLERALLPAKPETVAGRLSRSTADHDVDESALDGGSW